MKTISINVYLESYQHFSICDEHLLGCLSQLLSSVRYKRLQKYSKQQKRCLSQLLSSIRHKTQKHCKQQKKKCTNLTTLRPSFCYISRHYYNTLLKGNSNSNSIIFKMQQESMSSTTIEFSSSMWTYLKSLIGIATDQFNTAMDDET